MLGAGNALADGANRVGHQNNTPSLYDNRRPGDVVDGEYVMSNEFGVLLGLYQEMANLKASELAQIQCFLLDDLVRIISHNYQHYTVLGEYNIYHDGRRIMAEFGATHKPSESYGVAAVAGEGEDKKIFEEGQEHKVDDSKDFYEFPDKVDERVKAVERFKVFLGSVGDFVHMFLVRPDPTELRVNDPETEITNPDLGLADVHLGTDGGIHVRSVKEIFIEKTNWIRVPLRKAAPDDPGGDDARKLDYKFKEGFEFNNNALRYKDNPLLYGLQIRDYVAYVNEKLNYQNFKSHEKDFYVNDKLDDETNLKNVGTVDAETPLNQSQYSLRTAGIYLMPNGGITIRDAWNSAIIMEGGNVYIQPAKDLIAQPLRNNIVKAGGHINMACKKSIDFSSSEEGVRMKSSKSQYFYSDTGGLIFEAKGEVDTAGIPEPQKEAVEYVGGIVLKSKLGIYSYAEKDILLYAKSQLLLQSIGTVDVVANTTATIYGKQALQVYSDGSANIYSSGSVSILSDSGCMLAGANYTALGQKDQNLALGYSKDSPFVDILQGAIEVSEMTKWLQEAKESRKDVLDKTTFQDEQAFDNLQFKFLATAKYGIPYYTDPSLRKIPLEDAFPATLAQQDDLLSEVYSLQPWEETPVNDTHPYPGADLFEYFYYSVEEPANLEKNGLGKDLSNKADSAKKPGKLKLESLNKYTIQWI